MTTTAKPKMSKKERSLHTTRAAIAARKQAQSKGADDSAIDALMFMKTTLEVGGIKLLPYSQATVWALQAVGSKFVEEQTRPAELFATIDLDEDGIINLTDLISGSTLPRPLLTEWFTKVDADQDGKVSIAEFIAVRGLPRPVEPKDIVIAALCFAEPKETWFACKEHDGVRKIEERAFDVAMNLKPDQVFQLNQFMGRWFTILEASQPKTDNTPGETSPPATAPAGRPTTTAEAPAGP